MGRLPVVPISLFVDRKACPKVKSVDNFLILSIAGTQWEICDKPIRIRTDRPVKDNRPLPSNASGYPVVIVPKLVQAGTLHARLVPQGNFGSWGHSKNQ